ncbi:RNA exonuclease 5 [Tupaia chinensis]|uniref:RNA exonuclease 5 n=1 Tax=Tupaia chinensis TaxID=246437 RepID=UPI000FFBD407|nr:RNA exonuclease 5 [Tupaia chinensis]
MTSEQIKDTASLGVVGCLEINSILLFNMDRQPLFIFRGSPSRSTALCYIPTSCRLCSSLQVLEQARVEIPLFPFSIVQFSFEPFSPILTEEMNKRMRIKWAEMSTVYAGPFSKNCDLRALKRLFKSFGPVRSLTLVLETHQVREIIKLKFLTSILVLGI